MAPALHRSPPEQAIAVSDARQTEEPFAGAFGQYEGVSRSVMPRWRLSQRPGTASGPT